MNNENMNVVLEELSTEDKVRTVFFNVFSSKKMYTLTIFYTILTALMCFYNLIRFNIVGVIIPILITVSLWKIYKNAVQGTTIEDSGFQIIKGVATFYFIIIVVIAIISLIAFIALSLFVTEIIILAIPILLLFSFYGFCCFVIRKVAVNINEGYVYGRKNTKYFKFVAIILFLTALIILFGSIIFSFANWNDFLVNYFNTVEEVYSLGEFKEIFFNLFEVSTFDKVINFLIYVLEAVSMLLIGYLLLVLKNELDKIF